MPMNTFKTIILKDYLLDIFYDGIWDAADIAFGTGAFSNVEVAPRDGLSIKPYILHR